jgi:hypothetical protein
MVPSRLFDGFYAFYQRNLTSARFFLSEILPNGKFYFQIGGNSADFSQQILKKIYFKRKMVDSISSCST